VVFKKARFNLARELFYQDVEAYKNEHGELPPNGLYLSAKKPKLRKLICFFIGHSWGKMAAVLVGVQCSICYKEDLYMDINPEGQLVKIYFHKPD